MTTSSSSSNASPPLRLELRASRLLAASLSVIGLAAGAGLFLTDLPVAFAASLAPAVVAWGAVLARREAARSDLSLVLHADGTAQVDGLRVERFRLDWQGVLARLEWTVDGRRERRVAWPDVLDAAARRELRLWALGRGVRASTAAVAP